MCITTDLSILNSSTGRRFKYASMVADFTERVYVPAGAASRDYPVRGHAGA